MVLYDLGQAAEAKPLLERALTIHEEVFGPTSAEVAACLENLALALSALGEAAMAERLHRRAVAITDARSRPGVPD
jgi:hypothetical protein